MTERIASCSCGQLEARVSAEPRRVSVCHCLACQRRTGSVFGAQASFAPEAVELAGQASEYVRVGDGGTRARFRFCPRCGATVLYTLEGRPEIVVIPVGAFGDPQFPAPSISIYEERMHAWVRMPPGIEHMP